jgi:hypothetical protein
LLPVDVKNKITPLKRDCRHFHALHAVWAIKRFFSAIAFFQTGIFRRLLWSVVLKSEISLGIDKTHDFQNRLN